MPHATDWRTSDQDEINRRRLRAARETMRFRNLTPEQPFFSNFSVESASGQTYQVELRSLKPLASSCTCVDFRVNGLGTCKHVEALLRWLRSEAAAVRQAVASISNTGKIGKPLVSISGKRDFLITSAAHAVAYRDLVAAQGRADRQPGASLADPIARGAGGGRGPGDAALHGV